MKKRKINLNKLKSNFFSTYFSTDLKISILDTLLEECLDLTTKERLPYQEVLKEIIFYEIYNLSGYKNLDEIDSNKEYFNYINEIISKIQFFIYESDTKEFIEKLLKVYSFIFIIKESIKNLLKDLYNTSIDLNDSELTKWVNTLREKYYTNNIIYFPSKIKIAAASEDIISIILVNNYIDATITLKKQENSIIVDLEKIIQKENKELVLSKIQISFYDYKDEKEIIINLFKNIHKKDNIFSGVRNLDYNFDFKDFDLKEENSIKVIPFFIS